MDEFDLKAGQFQAAWTPDMAVLLYVPNGQRMATVQGEQLVIELKPGTTREEAQTLADHMNELSYKISIRDLSS